MEEEDGGNEGEGEDQHNEGVSGEEASKSERRTSEIWRHTHTRRPGESSVYSFNIVFEEPPAPAAREELGLETCEPVALRLQRGDVSTSELLRTTRRSAPNLSTRRLCDSGAGLSVRATWLRVRLCKENKKSGIHWQPQDSGELTMVVEGENVLAHARGERAVVRRSPRGGLIWKQALRRLLPTCRGA